MVKCVIYQQMAIYDKVFWVKHISITDIDNI